MFKKILYLLLLIPFASNAQYSISGRVVDIVSKKPIADATILLSNASAGTKANNDGTFTITNVRGGQYEVVVSIIGYETYKQSVLVNKDINLGDVGILQKSIVLQEVKIGVDKHWEDNYARFKVDFLGITDNAGKCEILNPHILCFDHDNGDFTATADGFLEIVNKALGYKIKYLLSAFTENAKTGRLYFAGTAFFENLPGKERQLLKWKKNRQQTYLGSDMHFLRSVIAGKVKEEGFVVRRIIRKPNPEYKGGRDNKYIQTLVSTKLTTKDYLRLTDINGEYAIDFKDCMCIDYNDDSLSGSIITFEAEYGYFDNNGIFLNPQDITLEGAWGESKIADLLPIDYEP